MNTISIPTSLKALLLAAALTASACAMQPAPGTAPPGGPDSAGGPPPRGPEGERGPGARERGPGLFDPGAMKARMERRLEEITREQARLREALERLAKGESPEELVRGLPMGRRPGRDAEQMGPGAGGPGEPPREGMKNGPRGGPREGMGEGERGGPGERMREPRGGQGERADGGPAEHEQLMGVLREAMPGLAAKVEEASRKNPELARRMMERWAPRLREAAELKRNDPDLFVLRIAELREGWNVIESSRSARELSRPSHDGEEGIADKRTKARQELKDALSRQFDARLAMQSYEVRALENRLEELRSHLTEQKGAKDARIGETLDKILTDKDLPLESGRSGERPPRGERP